MSLRTGLAAAVTCAIVGASVALLLATGGSSGGTGSGPNASIFTPSAIDPAHTGKSVTGIPKRAERSRQQYRDLASRTAKRVARSRFRSALTGPGEGAPHLRRGERIVSFLDDYTARTKSGEKRGLLLSSLPLRTRDSDGAKRPIKLTLQRQAGAYVPESPLVPTRFGATLDRGLALHDLVTAVPGTAAGRSSAVAERLGADRVFYPGIARDTDFIAESTTLGFETYWQLRSPASPERQVLRNRLARGVELREAGDLIAIVKEGKVVGQITPPTAVDAAGRSVRVDQQLHGSDLELRVVHRRRDVTYPVLVDPYYMENDGNFHGEDWWHPGTPTWHAGNPEGLEAWQSYTNNNFIGAGIVCNYNVSCFDGNTTGLFLQSQPGFYYNNSGAFYQYQAQGQGASTYIDHFEGAFVVATTKGAPVTSSANFQVLNTSGGVVGDSGNVMNGAAVPSAGASSGSGGTLARVQLKMIGDGTRSTWNSISVGAALVHITEDSAPSLQSETLSWNQNTWYNGTQPITAAVTFLSTGLGVKEIHYGVPTPAGGAGEQVPYPCDGKYATRCPYSYSATFAIPTEQIPEGVNDIRFGATTPAGHGSAPLSRTYKVDHTPPNEIRIYGELAGKENGVVPVGSHSFYAWASDMGCTSNGTRSGIKQITVLVDGNSAPGYGPAGSPGCTGQTGTIPLTLAAGEHAIEVTAIDGMGLQLVKAFTLTAVPPLPPNNVSRPAITGAPVSGETLVATPGVWEGTEPITYSYQWYRCTSPSGTCSAVSGATSNQFGLSDADVGRVLKVWVTATNNDGSAAIDSNFTDVVGAAPGHPVNTAAPTATGLTRDGEVLTAHSGSWSSATPPSFSYRWRRCDVTGSNCADIDGASAQTYTLTPDDVGNTLRVVVTADDGLGTAPALSPPTAKVDPAPPVNTSVPTISGAPYTGSPLAADAGTWTGVPEIGFAYRWKRCDAAGANCADLSSDWTDANLRPDSTDAGATIRVAVTAINDDGETTVLSAPTAVISSASAPVPGAAPVVSGTAQDGATLTVSDGTWTGQPAPYVFGYQWQRCATDGSECEDIADATEASYVLRSADVHHTVRATVSAFNPLRASQTSNASAVVSFNNAVDTATRPTLTTGPRQADTCGSVDEADWCDYARSVDAWTDDVWIAVDRSMSGSPTGGLPSPPEDYKAPADCTASAGTMQACYARAVSWAIALKAWLTQNDPAGLSAAALPDFPVDDDTTASAVEVNVTSALSGWFSLVRGLSAGTTRARVQVSFSSPVDRADLHDLAIAGGTVGATSLRGSYVGSDGVITAGFEGNENDLLDRQLDWFYASQASAMAEVADGLSATLSHESDSGDRAGTQASLDDVNAMRASLDAQSPFVSAFDATIALSAVWDYAQRAGTPINAVRVVSSGLSLATAPPLALAQELLPLASDSASSSTCSDPAAGNSTVSRFMPNRWTGRTKWEEGTDAPYVKNTYLGVKWTQPCTLDWYHHDKSWKRGFELEGMPLDGIHNKWSTDWQKYDQPGPCPYTDGHGCYGTWNSNLPSAYRDTLWNPNKEVWKTNRDTHFAIGTPNARALKYKKGYFAWYLTNKGNARFGRVRWGGQKTARPSGADEEALCLAYRNDPAWCYFGAKGHSEELPGWYRVGSTGFYDLGFYNWS